MTRAGLGRPGLDRFAVAGNLPPLRAHLSGMRMRGGDPDGSFAVFVTARWPQLVRLASVVAGDWAVGEDAAQAALARVWLRWAAIAPEARVTYARRAVLNEVLATRRRGFRRELPVSAVPEVTVGDGAERRAQSDLLNRALEGLAPRARAVVVLRHLEDLAVNEVAGLLGITEGAVKSMNARALAQLRVALGTREESM